MREPAELIRLYCANGDADAFREFYRAQAPRLWRYLVARGSRPEDAYDLLAEAFARFVETVCRDPSAPVAYLYRIATNLRIDAWRRSRASPVESGADPDAVPGVSEAGGEDAVHLRELIAGLPPGEQNLLLLRYWIGLSHKETAQALGMPEGTVRRQCAELVEKLRKSWDRDDGRRTEI